MILFVTTRQLERWREVSQRLARHSGPARVLSALPHRSCASAHGETWTHSGQRLSGFTTLDALLASRAPKALLVIDPIEAALAVTIATRVQPSLVRVGFSAGPLDALRNAASVDSSAS